MNSPFFSIVLPTYNRAHILPKAIESLINQEFQNWELIIVDDGSKDNTKDVVAAYSDQRVRYIYQDNAERSAARNNGIQHAKGQYVGFLDSDDYYETNHLQLMKEKIGLENHPIAMIFTGVSRETNGQKTPMKTDYLADAVNPVCFFLEAKESIIPARVCLSKEILKEFKFPLNINISEDLILWTQIAEKYPIFQIEERTVVYFMHDENSTNILKNPFKDQLISLKIIFNNRLLKSHIPLRVKFNKLSTCYKGIGDFHLQKESYMQVVKHYFISILYNPFSKNTKYKLYTIFVSFKAKLNSNRKL